MVARKIPIGPKFAANLDRYLAHCWILRNHQWNLERTRTGLFLHGDKQSLRHRFAAEYNFDRQIAIRSIRWNGQVELIDADQSWNKTRIRNLAGQLSNLEVQRCGHFGQPLGNLAGDRSGGWGYGTKADSIEREYFTGHGWRSR